MIPIISKHAAVKGMQGLGDLAWQLHAQLAARIELVLDSAGEYSDKNTGHSFKAIPFAAGNAVSQREALAISYWAETQEQASAHDGCPCSFTLDATNVGKHTIQDAAVLWPSNVASWLFPQEAT